MKFMSKSPRWHRIYPGRKENGLRLSQNQGKPANSTNNVSFAELMRQLRGGS